MKKQKNILLRVPISIWIVFAVFILILLALPSIFIQPGFLDFSQTGQIGDTIGGTMGPFIAIVAALLTFIAFWVQYEANIKQRDDIAIERHEAKYYKMLDIYSNMTTGLCVHGIKGKEAFAELVGELTCTFYTIDEIFNNILCQDSYLSKASSQLVSIINEYKANRKKRDVFLTNLAYNLFFYGSHYMVVDIVHPENTALGEEIKKIAIHFNQHSGERTFTDYVKSGFFDIHIPNNGLASPLYEGHSDFLGHYFRHIFQMVKYVASLDNDLFEENEKYGYVKLLRAQMSDYEQILLYYNSLSDQGKAWNKKEGEKFPEEAGYITRFRMIKNLPRNFPTFGVIPIDFYKEDAAKWERIGKKFYENRFLPIRNR